MCPSVRQYVRPYVHKVFFSDFDLIWCAGRPPPHMRTSVTLTWSKVKVKVTDLPKLRKLHCSRSIFFAVLARNSKLMADGDSMGPGLQLVVWISSWESYHESSNFADCRYFTKFKWPYFGSAWCYSHVVGQASSPTCTVYVGVTLIRSKVKVKVTDHLNFRQLPITAHF